MQKTFIPILVLVMVIGFGVSNTFAEPYFSANLGAVSINDSDIDDGSDKGEITFDTGIMVTGAIGNSFETVVKGALVELELGYRTNNIDKFKVDGSGDIGVGGEASTISLMGNAYYVFSTPWKINPFIGAGIGYANVEADFDDNDENDNVFAYQAMLGVSYVVNGDLSVDFQYRYFGTDDPDFGGLEAEYTTNNVMIGFRHSFY